MHDEVLSELTKLQKLKLEFGDTKGTTMYCLNMTSEELDAIGGVDET